MSHLKNTPCTLSQAATLHGGIEDPEQSGTYIFADRDTVTAAIIALSGNKIIPKAWSPREYKLRASKDAVLISTNWIEGDDIPPPWTAKRNTKNKIIRLVARTGAKADHRPLEERCRDFDDYLRALTNVDDGRGADAGWVYSLGGIWTRLPTEKIKFLLLTHGLTDTEAKRLCGDALEARWRLTCVPFAPEYPGNRHWNRDAPQLKYAPIAGPHPHWDMIFSHVGQSLDSVLPDLEWAQRANITTGADYLRTWTAIMVRQPLRRLPYLFFFHPKQNTGKSTFHESVALLMTRGVASADKALTSGGDFCGELEDAVLCVIEEKDVSVGGAYAKIKDWVTSLVSTIHVKGKTPYTRPNIWHFIQCANDRAACPVFPGDSRITMLSVPRFSGIDRPKDELQEVLKSEAPAFTHTLLNLALPPIETRLGLPAVDTDEKTAAAESSVPDFIVALVSYMHGRETATLYVKDFPDALGPGNWPGNMRAVKRLVGESSVYLSQHGVSVRFDIALASEVQFMFVQKVSL